MRPKPKTLKQIELEVENFNLKYKPGDKVKLKVDSGNIVDVTVLYPASIFMDIHQSDGLKKYPVLINLTEYNKLTS